jgi:hypothetical protein
LQKGLPRDIHATAGLGLQQLAAPSIEPYPLHRASLFPSIPDISKFPAVRNGGGGEELSPVLLVVDWEKVLRYKPRG